MCPLVGCASSARPYCRWGCSCSLLLLLLLPLLLLLLLLSLLILLPQLLMLLPLLLPLPLTRPEGAEAPCSNRMLAAGGHTAEGKTPPYLTEESIYPATELLLLLPLPLSPLLLLLLTTIESLLTPTTLLGSKKSSQGGQTLRQKVFSDRGRQRRASSCRERGAGGAQSLSDRFFRFLATYP